ncbi:MAG: peptidoglycan DD-metalloendopeptidase family protein [Acidimicrobiales bacterium]|nr:peptidoglycan DD-metalloendopeptidase family protein [Acidimicrobiales bacterium]
MFAILSISTAAAEDINWLPPVEAEVVDPFRPPTGPYGPGNLGLEFRPEGIVPVRAVAPGRVTFAGSVGGNLFVSVDHGDGLVSTLGFLSAVEVVRGQRVSAGSQVGSAGSGLHLTARLHGVYIDPAALISGGEVAVALVGGVPAPEAGRGGVGTPWGRGHFDSVAAVAEGLDSLMPSTLIRSVAEAVEEWHHPECTTISGRSATTPEGERLDLAAAEGIGDRVLIQVGGLGSSSEAASIGGLEPDRLGYGSDDVKSFSYAGGCIARPFGQESPGWHAPGHTPKSYGPADTYQDIDLSARRLADLVTHVAASRPEATIDIAAHSLGGVVARRALQLLHDRGDLDHLGVVMTIGSPHRGADLATLAAAAHGGLAAIDQLSPQIGELRDAPSVVQLAEVGAASLAPAAAPPPGPTVVAIAGSTDPIVPATDAIWDGATNVVVNLANPLTSHSDLPAAETVHLAFALAQRGAPPPCATLADTVAAVAGSTAFGVIGDSAAIAAGIAAWLV